MGRGECRFGALVLDAAGARGFERGTVRGLCDWGAGLADDDAELTGGPCAGVFPVEGSEGLPDGAMDGVLGRESVDDELFADGTAGCASSDIANGEI